jgi:hypothetical protein
VSIRLLNRHTRDPSRSCISRSTSQSHSLSDSISQRASLFTYHLVRTGYSPVPSSRFTLITSKALVNLPTDYASSGSGSVHRIVTYAELATAPTQLTSSRACHRHVTAHTYTLHFHKALTTFFSSHKDVQLVLCWAPKDDDLEGDWMARSLATAACQRSLADLPNGIDRILSAAYQKDRAHRRAFHQWELDYHLARAHNDLQISATGLPLDGAAYQYTISQPPSEVNHPLWSATVAMEKDKRGRKTQRPLFPRRTTSTVFQLAIDHAFTGSYASKFRPLDLPSSLYCPCSHPICDPHHLIRDCCLHYLTHISCKITTRSCTLPLKSLLSHSVEHAHRLLSFIHHSHVAMCPPEIGQPIPVEPEPD